jgi:hypothetical protein
VCAGVMNEFTVPTEKTDEETNKKKPQFPDDSAVRGLHGPPLPLCPHVFGKRTLALSHCNLNI